MYTSDNKINIKQEIKEKIKQLDLQGKMEIMEIVRKEIEKEYATITCRT